MAGRARTRNLLPAGGQAGHVADGQRLRVENLLAPSDRRLLAVSRVLPRAVDREYIGIELFTLRVATEGIINSRVILLCRQILRAAIGTFLPVQIARMKIDHLGRVEFHLEADNIG